MSKTLKTLSDISRHLNLKQSENVINKDPVSKPRDKNVPIQTVLIGDFFTVNGKKKRIKSVNCLIR